MKMMSMCCAMMITLAGVACAPKDEPAEPATPAEATAPVAAATTEPQPVATPEQPMGLAGTLWLVSEIAGETILTPADARQPFIEFDAAAKSTHGFAGCNTFRGGYESDGASLKFGALASTKMACGPDRDKVEVGMHQALGQVTGYSIANGELTLKGVDGAILVKLNAQKD